MQEHVHVCAGQPTMGTLLLWALASQGGRRRVSFAIRPHTYAGGQAQSGQLLASAKHDTACSDITLCLPCTQHSTAQHSTPQHSTAQHSTAQQHGNFTDLIPVQGYQQRLVPRGRVQKGGIPRCHQHQRSARSRHQRQCASHSAWCSGVWHQA